MAGKFKAELPGAAQKPAGVREWTPRAVIASMAVAFLIAASYPYVVLKLGFGPNISVVSAFFGYLALGIVFRDYNRWENNIVQTAGTSAGMTAFLCVLMAAFDLLRQDPSLNMRFSLTPMHSFLWLSTAGILGVLLAAPMRRHFVVDEKLAFPDGIAAAETLIVLDSRGPEARAAARSMGIGTACSAALMLLREDARLLSRAWYVVPETLRLGPTGGSLGFGVGLSLLSLGSGMLVGLRVNASMLAGTLFSWLAAPAFLLGRGFIPAVTRKDIILWVMWPAAGLMVAGGLTALLKRWRILLKTFRNLRQAHIGSDDFPLSWVGWGSLASLIALLIVQKEAMGMPLWMTATAALFSLPLMLVCLRVVGETNWAPISVLSNMMQLVFGIIAPGRITANLSASGVTGSIASESQGLMQDYKTGELIGSTPRYLTYAQLLAVPIGAAAVSLVYPLLRKTYGIGGESGLQSPISQQWAGFARISAQGFSSLPPGALAALAAAVLLGVLLTLLESTRFKKFLPSATGLGIGMLVPAGAVAAMFLGGAIEALWGLLHKKSYARHMTPLASGFIAGEALVAVALPILFTLGLAKLR